LEDQSRRNRHVVVKAEDVDEITREHASHEEKTAAADFPGHVPQQVVKSRSAALRSIGARKRRAFYSAHIGRELAVLVEGGADGLPGHVRGWSSNYIPVVFEGPAGLRNHEVAVVAGSLDGDTVRGATKTCR
jgi:threonylcarbamoyladenosine tRNA methylthiotransferase MtaB